MTTMESFFLLCLTYAIALTVLLAGTAFLFLTLYTYYQHEKYAHIPGPKRENFYLGNTATFIKEEGFFKVLNEWRREFGQLYVCFGMYKPMLICSDSAVIKAIVTRSMYLKPEDNYRPFYALFGERLMHRGLVSVIDHGAWSKRRALFNPAFHRKYLMGLMDQFNSSSDHLINHLTQFADGRTEVKMLDEFGRLTLDIIAKVGFGMEEDFISQPDHPLCRVVPSIIFGMGEMYRKPFLGLSPLPHHMAFKKKTRSIVRQFREMGHRCVDARIEALKRGDDVPPDILTYILKASHNLSDEGFGKEEMVDEFCTFFGAGQETTANLLAFTLLQLGRNPHVMEKLREEVLSVLKDKDFVEYADVTKMSYLGLVLKEALRLNPPVAGTSRVIHQDTEMCGYNVPAGTQFVASMFLMGQHEDHFKDPLTFDPDRFTRNEDKPLFAFFPFSLGARNCIGQVFAQIEAKVIMSKLVKKFDFRLVPGQSFDFVEDLTMKPKDKCKNFITLRT